MADRQAWGSSSAKKPEVDQELRRWPQLRFPEMWSSVPEGAGQVRSCPRQLWGFRFLVCKMEAVKVKAVSLAVVKIESDDGSEEELEEEEEKGGGGRCLHSFQHE